MHSVLASLCAHLEKYYLLLKNEKFDVIRRAYLERMYGLSQTIEFRMDDRVRHLYVKGVSVSGLLDLLDEDGKTLEADVKQLKWIF